VARSSSPRTALAGSTASAFVTPMAAQVVKALPEGDEWLYEVKWDG
jgi:ATP-dependent DNA ligase